MPELHRVLRPAGGLALLWNNRDQEAPLQREISALIAPFVPTGRASTGDSSGHLAESDLFGPIEERRFRFVQELDADGLVQRLASTSFVAAAPAELRAQFEQKLRDLVASKGGSVEFPYVTDVCVSRAV
jgi:hypothetical protein